MFKVKDQRNLRNELQSIYSSKINRERCNILKYASSYYQTWMARSHFTFGKPVAGTMPCFMRRKQCFARSSARTMENFHQKIQFLFAFVTLARTSGRRARRGAGGAKISLKKELLDIGYFPKLLKLYDFRPAPRWIRSWNDSRATRTYVISCKPRGCKASTRAYVTAN